MAQRGHLNKPKCSAATERRNWRIIVLAFDEIFEAVQQQECLERAENSLGLRRPKACCTMRRELVRMGRRGALPRTGDLPERFGSVLARRPTHSKRPPLSPMHYP